jgi:hypothetical protein
LNERREALENVIENINCKLLPPRIVYFIDPLIGHTIEFTIKQLCWKIFASRQIKVAGSKYNYYVETGLNTRLNKYRNNNEKYMFIENINCSEKVATKNK